MPCAQFGLMIRETGNFSSRVAARLRRLAVGSWSADQVL